MLEEEVEKKDNLPDPDSDVEDFENMTLAELVEVFGTDEKFKTWMQGRESILNIKSKEKTLNAGNLLNNKKTVVAREMTTEQRVLFNKLTRLKQEIALNSLAGMNDIDSYKGSSGKAKSENTMAATVSEILRNPKVVAFLDAMKASIVNDAIMSREEMMRELTPLCRAGSEDCENITLASLTRIKGGVDLKLKSMKQLAELGGYDAPKEVVSKSLITEIPSDMSPEDAAKAYQDIMGA